jgi:hypothetical protein
VIVVAGTGLLGVRFCVITVLAILTIVAVGNNESACLERARSN